MKACSCWPDPRKNCKQVPKSPAKARFCLHHSHCKPNLDRSAFACWWRRASCQQLNPTKAAIRKRVGGCTQQDLRGRGWDPDLPIHAQTTDVIVGSVLSTPNPTQCRYIIEARSCISCSHCSSSFHFFVSLFYSKHFLNLSSKNTLTRGCYSLLHNVIKE